jgi:CRP/FNR family transcriptional regulator, anaerobic regulatory protein
MRNTLIAYLSLLNPIPEADEVLITEAFRPRAYKSGETLFQAGGAANELFFICQGVIKITTIKPNGDEVTNFFLKENQFCTILHSFTNRLPAEENIVAACDVSVLAVTWPHLMALYEKLPYLKAMIDRFTQQGLMEKIRIRNAYHGEDSTTRYQLFIMRQPDIALRVPLKDIASYLDITPQSLSRIRRKV